MTRASMALMLLFIVCGSSASEVEYAKWANNWVVRNTGVIIGSSTVPALEIRRNIQIKYKNDIALGIMVVKLQYRCGRAYFFNKGAGPFLSIEGGSNEFAFPSKAEKKLRTNEIVPPLVERIAKAEYILLSKNSFSTDSDFRFNFSDITRIQVKYSDEIDSCISSYEAAVKAEQKVQERQQIEVDNRAHQQRQRKNTEALGFLLLAALAGLAFYALFKWLKKRVPKASKKLVSEVTKYRNEKERREFQRVIKNSIADEVARNAVRQILASKEISHGIVVCPKCEGDGCSECESKGYLVKPLPSDH